MQLKNAVFILLLLLGCTESTTDIGSSDRSYNVPDYDPNNPGPWCAAAADVAQNPWLSEIKVQMLLATMQNRGCFS